MAGTPEDVCFAVILNQRQGELLGFDFTSLPEPNRVAVIWDLDPGAHFIYLKHTDLKECDGSIIGQFVTIQRSQVLVLGRTTSGPYPFEILDNYSHLELKESIFRGLYKGQIARIPADLAKLWRNLTTCINAELLRYLEPLDHAIAAAGKRFKMDPLYSPRDAIEQPESRLERQVIYYSPIPKIDASGKCPQKVTQLYMDSSTTLDKLCSQYKFGQHGYTFGEFANARLYALGEMQHAYIAFVQCFNFQSFQQYKELLRLFCNAESILVKDAEFAREFTNTLEHQMEAFDFQSEMLGQDFLSTNLQILHEIATDYDILHEEMQRLQDVFKIKFGVDLQMINDTPLACEIL
ncbi:bifunctional A1 cistron-splicing factor [Babesia duncani]|uniref:Bifunctional A1 cistron-splicing factor n=1 Tax=Babesia duncani TaxID=323732 RepID=A0AAD9PNI8_9APIC|nr:bifunctional A1 cistron-splicing factor [Babesia duncani]